MGSEMCIRDRCKGGKSYIISSALVGLDFLTAVIVLHASLFNLRSLSCVVLLFRVCPHIIAPYVSTGDTIPVNPHFISFGFGPKFALVSCTVFIKNLLHLLIFSSMCSYHANLESIFSPKYVQLFEYSIGLLFIFS